MVYRVYVEKKEALANEARALLEDLRAFLGIQSLTGLRLFNRYDLEGISRELFDYAVQTVLSEPQLDTVTSEVPQGDTVFAVEYLPGQYDQRADSAAQCIQILSQGERPTVRTARVYVLEGELTAEQVEAVKKYVINPVESREASLELPETLRMEYDIPTTVRTVEGFTSMDAAALDALRDELGLAMDLDDLKFLQDYFRDDEGRNPTITEIRVVDTYWSDHCRHTTFSTHIDKVEILEPAVEEAYRQYLAARVEVYGEEKAAKRPQTLMDIATIAVKKLKKLSRSSLVIDRRMRKTGFSLILSLHRSSVFSIPDSSSMSKSASIKAFFSSSSFPESQEATALSKMRLDLLKSSSRRKSPP